MNKRIHDAFDIIKADENIKVSTSAVLSEKILRRQKKHAYNFRYALSLAVALLTIFGGAGGYSLYYTPTSYISIDVNPSVELTLNRFDRVLCATGYNEDGEIVLANLDLKNIAYTKAIDKLLASEAFSVYLNEDSLLSFSVISVRDEELITGIKTCQAWTKYQTECGVAARD